MNRLEIDGIINRAKNIDIDKVTTEIMDWLINNVENYIDNQEKEFMIYLDIKSDEMSESKKMQDIYTNMPEIGDGDYQEDDEMILLDILDETSNKILNKMTESEDKLQKLFKRMIYFYEMTGFNNISGPIIQEMEGKVEILEFSFDPTTMELKISENIKSDINGELIPTGEKRLIEKKELPASFIIGLKIDYWTKVPNLSLY